MRHPAMAGEIIGDSREGYTIEEESVFLDDCKEERLDFWAQALLKLRID